jgi:hypothetical protein
VSNYAAQLRVKWPLHSNNLKKKKKNIYLVENCQKGKKKSLCVTDNFVDIKERKKKCSMTTISIIK